MMNSISVTATATAADNENLQHAAAAYSIIKEVVAAEDQVDLAEQDKVVASTLEQTKHSHSVGELHDRVNLEKLLFTTQDSTATTLMEPDIGILSDDFFKKKDHEKPIDKQFTIHPANIRGPAGNSVDVGILDRRRRLSRGQRWQRVSSDAGVHVHANIDKVTGRSLQEGEEKLPPMCPDNCVNPAECDVTAYLTSIDTSPKCSCPSPSTCGPELCECLELDADGDIFQCMDPLKQLCEGTNYIDGIPGPWSMENCLGRKDLALSYCSMLPCLVDGGSIAQCSCDHVDARCKAMKFARDCAHSKCCQAQTDDEGRQACHDGAYKNYYEEIISFTVPAKEMLSRFNECSFNSGDDKSIVQCYCESFSYGHCVNWGVVSTNYCEAMNCCWEQTDDVARLDCFTRFRTPDTGREFRGFLEQIEESCVASGKTIDQCKCDFWGLSHCVYGIPFIKYGKGYEPRCDLFQCCQSQTDDEGINTCLAEDDTWYFYTSCVSEGYSTEYCYCYKSYMVCSPENSDDFHCNLDRCCQEQSDDDGRKECIVNITASQPSSAPSGVSSIPPKTDAVSSIPPKTDASSPIPPKTDASSPIPPKTVVGVGIPETDETTTSPPVPVTSPTSSSSVTSGVFGRPKKFLMIRRKALAVTVLIGWFLLS